MARRAFSLGRRLAGHRLVVLTVLVTVIVLVGAGVALADPPPPAAPPPPSLDTVLTNIRNWVMGILGAYAGVCFTLAGLRYLAANSDPGELAKAKDSFQNGLKGVGLAVLAPTIVEVLKSIFGF
ncbi:hypothetical protein I6A60_01585 [Frankia sp. AgB1.9]|nr:hypothetical protein [Frankia sp. AgW1.1]MBL7546578.1 hypothetical protein [Frankia sp. AgB1.9]MBL7622961.1 hypothetical protein [Frankia sp. AgB1.8]